MKKSISVVEKKVRFAKNIVFYSGFIFICLLIIIITMIKKAELYAFNWEIYDYSKIGHAWNNIFNIATFFLIYIPFFVCVLLILIGVNEFRLINNFKIYAVALSSDFDHSISKLASRTGNNVEIVRKNITNMINKNYFLDAFLDIQKDCVVFKRQDNYYEQKDIEYVSVNCKGCGATNKKEINTYTECMYCGSVI